MLVCIFFKNTSGERMSAESVRIGVCLYSKNRKHILAGNDFSGRKYYCCYCGEDLGSATSVRIGVCLYHESRKHAISSCTSSGSMSCRYCGERMSSATSVRIGVCLYSKSRKHELP